ncbi:hypothetical protein [Proteiniphilum sp.]|uniref:hypothetical protein n=1 Tax=Proteiniphilum sp. TaxID=1926877 RepID=UPI002B20905B|nr:hypothetical protein [Proteiniphilum sp.]MEA4918263.1 hypothetical protein [Proteiniphilum sp.]
MKIKYHTLSRFQSMPKEELASIMGGDKEEDKIVYIDGKPYRIIIRKNGTTELVPVEM